MARDIGEQMILAEWLFVETVDDLRRRIDDPEPRTRYELLGIAPLLRKLLLDGAPLLETVRVARPEVPVEFRIRPWTELEDKFAAEGLERYLGLGDQRLIGDPGDPAITNLEELKMTVVGIAQGEHLTFRSVVRYYAHVEGGVHFGTAKDPGESTLSSMAPILLGHSTGQIQTLAHLGQITVDALEPMRRSILARPTIHTLLHRKDDRGLFMNHWTTKYFESQAANPVHNHDVAASTRAGAREAH